MGTFVALTSMRYISTKLIDMMQVTDAEGEATAYHHPFLQTILGYLGEFLIVGLLGLYYRRASPELLASSQKVSLFTLAIPAACDFFENMALIFGTTQIFPSVVSMSRALVLPITAVLSRCLIRKLFSWQMILALALLLSGMSLATFV